MWGGREKSALKKLLGTFPPYLPAAGDVRRLARSTGETRSMNRVWLERAKKMRRSYEKMRGHVTSRKYERTARSASPRNATQKPGNRCAEIATSAGSARRRGRRGKALRVRRGVRENEGYKREKKLRKNKKRKAWRTFVNLSQKELTGRQMKNDNRRAGEAKGPTKTSLRQVTQTEGHNGGGNARKKSDIMRATKPFLHTSWWVCPFHLRCEGICPGKKKNG